MFRYQRSDWAWLAGLLDGEGSFGVAKRQPTRVDNASAYAPCLSLEMTDTEALVKAADMMDTAVSISERHQGKTLFATKCYGQKLRAVLLNLLPWLRTKRQQADLLLAFFVDCPNQSGTRLTEEKKALREGYHLALKASNA